MNSLKWKIGDVEIIQIVELEAGKLIQSIIPQASTQNIKKILWLVPHFADQDGNLKALVQSFLIKSNGKNILIDTCNGNNKKRPLTPDWANLQTSFLETLRSTGITEENIDIVACTHMHFDHVGWNTKLVGGKWVPTFPNATYLFAKEEYNYWVQKPKKEVEDDHLGFGDSVSPILKAGLGKLVDEHYSIDETIRFIPSPGHTPHHISIWIESLGKKALISGDFLHHPCQVANPDWSTIVDTFPDRSIETRKKLLSQLADTDVLLLGSHFANPISGYIMKSNNNYMFKLSNL